MLESGINIASMVSQFAQLYIFRSIQGRIPTFRICLFDVERPKQDPRRRGQSDTTGAEERRSNIGNSNAISVLIGVRAASACPLGSCTSRDLLPITQIGRVMRMRSWLGHRLSRRRPDPRPRAVSQFDSCGGCIDRGGLSSILNRVGDLDRCS
jgi:hypothetical protein